jgi:hypothetical protein
MALNDLRNPELLLIAGLCAAGFVVAVQTQQTRPERHGTPTPRSLDRATLGADASARTAAQPPVERPENIVTPTACTDVHGSRAPELRTLSSRANVERYSQEVVRLPTRAVIARGYSLARALVLEPARDGGDGTIELWHHRTFVRHARTDRWIFEDVSAGGDCRDRRLVLRWLAPDGAVRDQLSILSGYADVRLANVPSDERRSVWLEHDDCHRNPRVQSQHLRLFDVRSGRLELAQMLDERGEWTALNTRNSLSSHWLIEDQRGARALSVDGTHVVTSDHIERLPRFPESLVIVGAGVVGCEYATIFANFGKTKVNIIDRQPRILPFEDDDVAEAVSRNFERIGITIHRESTLQSLQVQDGHVRYVLCDRDGSRCEPIDVERALISIGRVPNSQGLGLEAAGVLLDKSGGIIVKDTQSSVPHIHAAGDVTADVALVNVAELEGRHAVEAMFSAPTHKIRYDALSAIFFLSPEVAAVGLNEQQARKRGIAYRVGVLGNRLVPRTIAMRATDGFVKLLVSRDSPAKILGMRVVGPQAATAIQGIAFLIEKGGTLDDIDACVHPHPAVTEGVQECARAILGRSVLKPGAFVPSLLRVDEWAP